MEKELIKFIKENKIATIACSTLDGFPYCFHCFYVFDEENHLLFFKSSSGTHHVDLLKNNYHVAGSILPAKASSYILKGIQFTGSIISQSFPNDIDPEKIYHHKLPVALTKAGHVYCIRLERVKMTDNTNIFGKKLKWENPQLV
jgi:uncharacterized protein YhbP (UPF0306 family)